MTEREQAFELGGEGPYHCPEHGKIEEIIHVWFNGRDDRYCVRCWTDHMDHICHEVEEMKEDDERYP